jgi:U3 small nucleolar RNA-associated protein 21
VTNEIPYVINNFGNEYFMTTCVGSSFQTYNVIKTPILYIVAKRLTFMFDSSVK